MQRISYHTVNRVREGVQLVALLFLLAVPVLNLLGVHAIVGTLYAISIGPLDIADPAMVLQTVLLTREVYVPLLLAAVVPVVLALLFGRVFCSWMCPYNTLLEWVDRGRRFSKRGWLKAHQRTPAANPRPVWYWTIFAGLVAATVVVGLPLLGYLSAPGLLSSQAAQAILGLGVGLELALVGSLLAVEAVAGRRLWCTYGCPVGAMLAVFRTRWTLRLARDPSRCTCKTGAEPCHLACPLGLTPNRGDVYPYCFNCGLCAAACEKTRKGALDLQIGRRAPSIPAAAEPARSSPPSVGQIAGQEQKP